MLIEDDTWSKLALEHGVTFSDNAFSRDTGVDVTLEVPGWPGPVQYQVKATAQLLTPSLLKRWARSEPAQTVPLLIVTRSASPQVLRQARSEGVSVIVAPNGPEASVRGVLMNPDGQELVIEPPTEEPEPKPRARGRVPWGTYAVGITLLATYPDRPTQSELAERLDLTQGRVSQALRPLRNALAHRGDPRMELARWLQENYPTSARTSTTWMTLDPPVDAATATSEALSERGIRHAISGQVAADWLAPWSRPEVALVWAEAPTDLSGIGATPVARAEANLVLAVPADPHMLRSIRSDHDHPPIVEPWRVWLDLVANGDDQAADALRDRLLNGALRP